MLLLSWWSSWYLWSIEFPIVGSHPLPQKSHALNCKNELLVIELQLNISLFLLMFSWNIRSHFAFPTWHSIQKCFYYLLGYRWAYVHCTLIIWSTNMMVYEWCSRHQNFACICCLNFGIMAKAHTQAYNIIVFFFSPSTRTTLYSLRLRDFLYKKHAFHWLPLCTYEEFFPPPTKLGNFRFRAKRERNRGMRGYIGSITLAQLHAFLCDHSMLL